MKDYGIYINVVYVVALSILISITLKLFQRNFKKNNMAKYIIDCVFEAFDDDIHLPIICKKCFGKRDDHLLISESQVGNRNQSYTLMVKKLFNYDKIVEMIKKKDIQSVHNVGGKKVLVLKSVEPTFKPQKKKIKAKKYFSTLKNSK